MRAAQLPPGERVVSIFWPRCWEGLICVGRSFTGEVASFFVYDGLWRRFLHIIALSWTLFPLLEPDKLREERRRSAWELEFRLMNTGHQFGFGFRYVCMLNNQ